MASLLYRIGRAAAKRAWLFVISWILLLGLSAGAFFAFSGGLTEDIDIPGTPTDAVAEQLTDRFADGASGTSTNLLFATTDGEAFTDEQKDDIVALLADLADVDDVADVVDPFETAESRADSAQQLKDGREGVASGLAQLDDGQEQIDAALQQVEDAQAQLDAGRAQAEAAGQLEQAASQLDAQQAELDAAREEIRQQQAELDTSRTELGEQAQKLDESQALLDLSADLRQVSEDGSAAIATIQVDAEEIPTQTEDALKAAVDSAEISGVEAYPTDLAAGVPQVFGPGEAVGLLIAAITLFVMLGTLVGAGLPLVNALIGVGAGVLGSLALSSVMEMNSVTPILGVMLGLAVGIDYSLFILNRHRIQLRQGLELHESIGLANGTSGNAVVFAGATVLVALVALNVTGIPFLGVMGTVGAICVAIAILVAVTLTPALLGLVGNRITPRRERRAPEGTRTARPAAKEMSTSRAVVTLLAGLAGLLVVASPVLEMRLGLPDNGSEPVDSAAYRSYSITEEKFGAGANGPLLVTAELPDPIDDDDTVAEQVRVGQTIAAFDDVAAVAPLGVSDDDRMLAFQVIPEEGPASESTESLVHVLRDGSTDLPGVSIGVAGNASANIDISSRIGDALPLYLGVVIGLSLLILIVVFRSILVPLTATLGFVLSVLAAFGGVTAVFQWGWLGGIFGVHNPGPILSFMPTLLIGILFGLAMDYQLFLVSGMREAYVHGTPARLAVTRGLSAGRAVVVAAAIIMVSVFGGFVFSHSIMVQTIGFGLALGVLIDAFVIRMLLIPAAMHLLGKSAWWIPKWLDRILPDVDVEGAKLEREHLHPGAHP